MAVPLTRPSMSGEAPIVRRIDHIIIRVDDSEVYDRLYHHFSELLQLPTPWPVTEHPSMVSGGIFAGNVDFELLRIPVEKEPVPEARLYGLVFETWSEDFTRLATRDIPYLPAPYNREEGGKQVQLWMNLFLPDMLGSNPWMKLTFGIKRLIPDSLWMRLFSKNTADYQKSTRFFFNRVYRDGIVFVVKYNPGWRAVDTERRRSVADFGARRGGALGLIKVKEVVVGTTNINAAAARWHNLLRPTTENSATSWQVGDGPEIRLIAADHDALHHLVWQVESLADAAEVLEDLQMLGRVTDDEVAIDPAALYGLDIRLVEQ
jgi:hypothetical protein